MIPNKMAALQKKAINPRSFIPRPLNAQIRNQALVANGFGFPAAPQLTVNGVEKSGIPRPQARFMRQPASRNPMNIGTCLEFFIGCMTEQSYL